jgi:hypothetical protein
MRPVRPEDYAFLRAQEMRPELSVRWRARGAAGGPEEWVANLWRGVLCQFVVCRPQDPEPIGLAVIYRANFQDGHAYAAVESFSFPAPSPAVMFAGSLLIDYAFKCWNFAKLYFEVPEFNARVLGDPHDARFRREACLKRHIWFDGRHWDQMIFAVHRDDWRHDVAMPTNAGSRAHSTTAGRGGRR